jgi:hypothetical protein
VDAPGHSGAAWIAKACCFEVVAHLRRAHPGTCGAAWIAKACCFEVVAHLRRTLPGTCGAAWIAKACCFEAGLVFEVGLDGPVLARVRDLTL